MSGRAILLVSTLVALALAILPAPAPAQTDASDPTETPPSLPRPSMAPT